MPAAACSRRTFLEAALLSSLALALPGRAQPARRPNIVLILADDLGYGDIGCYGNTQNQTPHLDQMAREGLRFTDFHANGPVCSPTRAALLTGRYQQRMGIEHPIGYQGSGLGAVDETTIATRLQQAGYATGLMGKWHLGTQPADHPLKHGFDEFRGHLYSAQDYHSHVNRWGLMDWWHNDQRVFEEGYNTHLITQHSIDFIEAHRSQPFFLMVSHSAIHFPWMTPEDPAYRREGGNYDNLSKLGPHEDVAPVVKTMVEDLDASVGQILAALKENGLEEDTFVLFTSDNGGYRDYWSLHPGEISDNGPLRGQKTYVYEGGHRVPAIAWWPGTIAPGQETDATAMTVDFSRTWLEWAGASIPAPDAPDRLDGISLSPLLRQQERLPERTLFFRTPSQGAARWNEWKLVWPKGEPAQLYNLAHDLGETSDLAEKHPAIVTQLKEAYLAWQEDVDASYQQQAGS